MLETDSERQSLNTFAEKAYLDYAMYVILDRALPHIGDGLKPVQRRIVYAMSELGLSASTKPKKAARTVGDVIGKFHPHGDAACYEAMVIMAQPFTYRHPLVDGQGNWGTTDDPKSFAAMRYTESRLSAYAATLLSELGQGTVDWQPNFDDTFDEPATLPARLPNVLINGGTGIAVGMATDIPPHNLREVAAAAGHLLANPDADARALAAYLPGPDFPTGAEIITPAAELERIYANGHGMIRVRATYKRESETVVVDSLPYQTSGSRVLTQIAEQMQAKKLPMVADLRDESDHENPVRLVIAVRSSRVDVEQLMTHLFATTGLEKSVRVNLNVIGLDGAPQVKALPALLGEWLDYRRATVIRRLEHRLKTVNDRLHILAGLRVAYLNIDEIIAIIRREAEPKPALVAAFGLSETQAEAILNLRLRHLVRLEETKIQAEADKLAAERDSLTATLGSEQRLTDLIGDEIAVDAERYGDDRRTTLVTREAARALSESERVSAEPITVVLSQQGWIRAAKGSDIDAAALNYRSGDGYCHSVAGRSNQTLVVVDSSGRSYALDAHRLPSARGQGEPLTSSLNPATGVDFAGVAIGAGEARCVLAATDGRGLVAPLAALASRQKNGRATLSVAAGARALAPSIVATSNAEVCLVSSAGRLLVLNRDDLPAQTKGKGNRLISLKESETLIAVTAVARTAALVIYSGKRHMQLSTGEREAYRGRRAARGTSLPRGFTKVQRLASAD